VQTDQLIEMASQNYALAISIQGELVASNKFISDLNQEIEDTQNRLEMIKKQF
jgi:hypothetical protein